MNEDGNESLHANNRMMLHDQIDVFNETFAPVVDITVDGKHIEKGEIVSLSPEIVVMMWDENPFLLKQDTLGLEMKIGLCDDDECEMRRINFSGPDVTWTPATHESSFTLKYRPADLPPGEYRFEFAGADGSGNAAATQSILFTITNEMGVQISDV